MKPAPFRYIAAASLEEALALKAEHGDEAKFLAGGQSLIPAMNFRMAQPAVLIDINPLAALSYVKQDGNVTRIGALTRYRTLQRDAAIAGKVTLMAEALPEVAHPAIRNRGTLGGNLSHADPASELPAVVLALGGTLHARSKKGTRQIAVAVVGTLQDPHSDGRVITDPRLVRRFMQQTRAVLDLHWPRALVDWHEGLLVVLLPHRSDDGDGEGPEEQQGPVANASPPHRLIRNLPDEHQRGELDHPLTLALNQVHEDGNGDGGENAEDHDHDGRTQ